MFTPKIDFSVLGIKAASEFYTEDLTYRAFQRAGRCIFNSIEQLLDLFQVSMYAFDPVDQLFREETVITSEGALQGSELLPLHQLQKELTADEKPVVHRIGVQHEIVVPINSPSGYVGLLTMLCRSNVPKKFLEELPVLATGLSLGVHFLCYARKAKRAATLAMAASSMSRELQGISGQERLIYAFINMAVEQLGFDRATLFIFEEDGVTVRRALCASIGKGVSELKHFPDLPTFGSQPVPLDQIPGFWLPMRIGQRLLGALLVDNLYSFQPAPEDATQILIDLSGQVALSLENALLFERLQELALRDELTGLYRPGYFYERLKEEINHRNRQRSSASLLVLDLDFFKQVNDQFGHPAGDAVLVQASDLIKSTLRSGDIACRMGGDEFLILAPGATAEQGEALAERILDLFRSHTFTIPNGKTATVSISIGLATFPNNASDWQQLLYLADQVLYKSKKEGRGRVSICTQLPFNRHGTPG